MRTELSAIIQGCQRQEQLAQKLLYERFYHVGLGIARRYARGKQEAQEIVQDGFYKVFTKMDQYDPDYPFAPWFRRVIQRTAIDFYRLKKVPFSTEITEHDEDFAIDNTAIAELDYQDLLEVVQQLSPAYRLVFNLYVIDGYKHHEIAEQLQISVGTSKSNLAKAKRKIRELLAIRSSIYGN